MHRPRNSRIFKRAKNDWYCEPANCTAALLAVETLRGPVYDPACGQGNIVRTLIAAGVAAVGTDVIRRVPAGTDWWKGHRDFLRPDRLQLDVRDVVTNPPFGRGLVAEAFVRRALELVEPRGGKLAVFVPMRFLTGRARAEGLYAERPPHRAWVLAPRPSCPPGEYLEAGNKAEGGTQDFAWLVWDGALEPARAGETRLGFALRPDASAAAAEVDDEARAA